ncbi:MAG: RNA polymerase sigma factor RpoD/SigA [Spirochaetes bacterium]|nr:RNA polymerase sigma factor RpoD/SigA [Spirochaetota bacterium]
MEGRKTKNIADFAQDELLDAYFKQIKVFPLLTFEEEQDLSKKIQDGDEKALHKLVNANLRLVVKIAKPQAAPDISIMDLIQEGNMGLLQAAKKYDHKKNVRFCTYASLWIKQTISRYISGKHRLVKLPGKKEETLRKIRRAYHVLCQTLMHQPKNSDIAKKLGISVKELDYIINVTSGPLSIESNFTEGAAGSIQDVHEDYTYSPEQNMLKQSARDGTMQVLGRRLKEKERRVLSHRYQLNGSARLTLREISDDLEVSPETVRQIEIRALKKMRKHADELKDCVYFEAM